MTIIRLDTQTQFHIDLDWFTKNGRDLRAEMYAAFCDECRSYYPAVESARAVDRVNSQTGEVTRADSLWECLVDHCGLQPAFITPALPLTTAIFRAFLANGNHPMNAEQLYQRVRKSNPGGILKLLTNGDVENGVVPVNTNQ